MSDRGNDTSDGVAQMRLQFTDEIDAGESLVESDGGLVESMREQFGDDLRVVGVYDENTFELLYAKPSVRERYTQDELAATGDDFILSDRREDPYIENIFHLGAFRYHVHGFEDGQVVRVPLEDTKGLVVSFDSTVDVSFPKIVDQLKGQFEIVFR